LSRTRIRTVTFTHTGRRQANQDAVVSKELEDGRLLVAVADGMGGQAGGEVASATALYVLGEQLEKGETLDRAFQAANEVVWRKASEDSSLGGMGTTLVALLQEGGSYRVANVGDSRAYRLDESEIDQLTEDHSFVTEAVRSGELSQEEAEKSKWANAIIRSIGTESEVEVDIFGPYESDSSHAILLCSDGLSKFLPSEMMHQYVLALEDLGFAALVLASLAYSRGSDDNITLSLVEFGRLRRSEENPTLPPFLGMGNEGIETAVSVDTARREKQRRNYTASLVVGLILLVGAWGLNAGWFDLHHEPVATPEGGVRAHDLQSEGGIDEPVYYPFSENLPKSGTAPGAAASGASSDTLLGGVGERSQSKNEVGRP